MSSLFSINTDISESQSLKANTIHDVVFKGVESKTVGKDTSYKVLEISFEKPGVGNYSKTIFAPQRREDAQRQSQVFNGETRTSPSNVEQTMEIVRQLIAAVNPEFYKAFSEKDPKALAQWNPSTWDTMCQQLAKLVNPKAGAKLQIKLLAKSDGTPDIPGFPLGIASKTGNLFVGTKIFGTELVFTKREMDKIASAVNPAPSRMPSENAIEIPPVADDNTGSIDDSVASNDDLPF